MSLACLIGGAVGAILVAGILGGWINCLQAKAPEEPPKHGVYFFLLSIAAAASVPLFLSLTKSELLKNVLTYPLKAEDWFIFFAVCLVAAIYARSFLETVSKRLLQQTEEAKREAQAAKKEAAEAKQQAKSATGQAREALETVEQSEQAIERVESSDSAALPAHMQNDAKFDLTGYDEDEQKILNAMITSHLSRRSVGGLGKDTNLSREKIRETLKTLVEKGFVQETIGQKTGNVLYQLRLKAVGSK